MSYMARRSLIKRKRDGMVWYGKKTIEVRRREMRTPKE
jgi:hypothetical protein